MQINAEPAIKKYLEVTSWYSFFTRLMDGEGGACEKGDRRQCRQPDSERWVRVNGCPPGPQATPTYLTGIHLECTHHHSAHMDSLTVTALCGEKQWPKADLSAYNFFLT